MDLVPSSNPAAVNLDRTETKLVSQAACDGSDEETSTQPLKTRNVNGRTYNQIRWDKKRQKKRRAWYWQPKFEILMEEVHNGVVNREHRWVCQLCEASYLTTITPQSTYTITSQTRTRQCRQLTRLRDQCTKRLSNLLLNYNDTHLKFWRHGHCLRQIEPLLSRRSSRTP